MGKDVIKSKLLKAIEGSPYRNDIRSLFLFGSYVNGSPGEKSDVDVLVQFADDAKIGLFEYARIQRELSHALALKVDLVTMEGLSTYIKQQVLREAEVVYQG